MDGLSSQGWKGPYFFLISLFGTSATTQIGAGKRNYQWRMMQRVHAIGGSPAAWLNFEVPAQPNWNILNRNVDYRNYFTFCRQPDVQSCIHIFAFNKKVFNF